MGGVPTKVIAVGIDGTGSSGWRRNDGANSHVFRFITDINGGPAGGNIEAGVRSSDGAKRYWHGPGDLGSEMGDISQAVFRFVLDEMLRLTRDTGCAQTDFKICLVGHSRGAVAAIKVANFLNGDEYQNMTIEYGGVLSSPVQVGFIGLYDTVDRSTISINVAMPNVTHGSHARRQNRGSFLLFGGSRSTFGTVDIPARFPTFDVDTAHGGVGGDPGYFTRLGQMSADYYCNALQLIMTQEQLNREYGVHGSRMGVEPNYRPLTGSDATEIRARLARSVRDVARADDVIRAKAVLAGFSFVSPVSTLQQCGVRDQGLWPLMMSAIRS